MIITVSGQDTRHARCGLLPPVKGPTAPDNEFLKRFHAYQDAQPKDQPEPPKPVAAEPAKLFLQLVQNFDLPVWKTNFDSVSDA